MDSASTTESLPNVSRHARENGPRLLAGALAAALVMGAAARGQGPASTRSTTVQAPGESTGPIATPSGQSSAVEKFKDLTDPDALDKLDKKLKEKQKPPLEFFKSWVAPFDVLPFVKPGHWATVGLELKANHADYEGVLQSAAVRLSRTQEVVYRRGARLVKGQQARLGWQVMLPEYGKELPIDLSRPDAIRADGLWTAPLLRLEPHQMILVILARDPNVYNTWNQLQALIAPTRDVRSGLPIEQRRYYRMMLPLNPEKPALSPHPLTWTTISHVVWDDLGPEVLNTAQQQALVDWLHWGGQLIVVGGAGAAKAALQDRESFLGRYLPADATGEVSPLTDEELHAISREYPPPAPVEEWPEPDSEDFSGAPRPSGAAPPVGRPKLRPGTLYAPPESILRLRNRPILLSVLQPREDADAGAISTIPLVDGVDGSRLLGVERRVGRGRILMLGVSPTDPSLVAWKGLDTLVRRLVLRRPEEPWAPNKPEPGRLLAAPELTWVRLLGRDLGTRPPTPVVDPSAPATPGEVTVPPDPVAAWLDDAQLPTTARAALEDASGISIPGRNFVLKVLVAFALAVVPLNYLFCRFLLRRRELAWVMVPVLSLAFAVVVERGAARELGYDSAIDEIDLLEVHAGYPRGHLSRIAALYSTGRVRFTVAYPDEPSSLALPLNIPANASLRGADTTQAAWESQPVPALTGFQVQPRSLNMFRAEQMFPLGGSIRYVTAPSRRIVNATNLELRDAVLVDVGESGKPVRRPLGTIAAGAVFDLDRPRPKAAEAAAPRGGWTDPEPFLEPLRSYTWPGPEGTGERRLVAWTPDARPRQKITPPIDRARGLTMVVVHLAYGPAPSPGLTLYDTASNSNPTTEPTPSPDTLTQRP